MSVKWTKLKGKAIGQGDNFMASCCVVQGNWEMIVAGKLVAVKVLLEQCVGDCYR